MVAETRRGMRVLETSQPPAYYFPPDDVDRRLLRPTTSTTFCEWKGDAAYADVVVGDLEDERIGGGGEVSASLIRSSDPAGTVIDPKEPLPVDGQGRTYPLGSFVVHEGTWWYPEPTPAFGPLRDHLGFYAQKFDCFVDDEAVTASHGSFYGGWITSDVVGPFKGGPGTSFW